MSRRPSRAGARPIDGRALRLTLLLAVALPSVAAAGAAANARIAALVVGAGGGTAAGGGLRLTGTIGQAVVGRSRGAVGQVDGGFWAGGGRGRPTPTATGGATAGPSPTRTPTPPTPTPTATAPGERRWVVTTTDDADDGACDGAHCSLREALNAANDQPGADLVAFAIPSADAGCAGGRCTIRPSTPLPDMTDGGTTVDAYTQPGARPNSAPVGQGLNGVLAIVLDGSLLPDCCPSGLTLRGSGATVRGLVIGRFYTGIRLLGGSGSRIEGNFVGTDALGLAPAGNRCGGVRIEDLGGGDAPRDHVIGGASPAARNLLSGNTCVGLEIGGARGTRVAGNIVGADASGERALPNTYGGIRLFGAAAGSRIGGEGGGEPNTIAFNELYGVEVNGSFGSTDGNTIAGNRIHSNGGPGITLVGGGNHDLAAPVVLVAAPTSARGTACALCTVEVFSDRADEGERFEGRVRADAAGVWLLASPTAFAGPNLTATATNAGGDTSAFASPVPIGGASPTSTPTATGGPTATGIPTATPSGGPSATATGRPSATPARPSATPPPAGRTIWLPILARPPVGAGG